MIKHIFLILLSVLFIATFVEAAPTINSASGSATQLTLTGSGFGTKPSGPPRKWDNFNSGSNGSRLNWPVLTTNGGSYYPRYSNERLRTNDTMSAKIVVSRPQYNCSFGFDGGGNARWYISYWRYDIISGSKADNYKHFRVYGSGNNNAPQFYFTELGGSSTFGVEDERGSSQGHYTWTGIGAKNRWTREEFFVDTSNGIIKKWFDTSYENVPVTTSMIVGSGRLNRPRIGHFYGNGSYNSLTAYFSETYIDNTQARVEMGNRSTWSQSNHREIQIPSAWSNNSITITINKGTFSNGETVYLFVVDPNGSVSPGYAITLGGGTSSPPSPPANLKVVQ